MGLETSKGRADKEGTIMFWITYSRNMDFWLVSSDINFD